MLFKIAILNFQSIVFIDDNGKIMTDINIDKDALKLLENFKIPKDVVFGKIMAPAMIQCSYQDKKWGPLNLIPYEKLQIDPAAKVLHYAQEIFEGLKAYKNDDNRVFLFRPNENASRFNQSAIRMGMPTLPEDYFISSLEEICKYTGHSFSTELEDSFYLRPFMFGDEAQLGVKPSTTYQYYLIGGPVGNYFSGSSVKVRVERDAHRAAPMGTGFAKTGGNYAASLASSLKTSEEGFDQTLWLDPVHNKYIEELSGMNFFAVIDGVLTTPKLSKSILHGITRDSLLKLATHLGYKIAEKEIEIEELLKQIESGHCSEAFACGTASVLTSIACLKDRDKLFHLKETEGRISKTLKEELLFIQTGRKQDPFGWVRQVNLY